MGYLDDGQIRIIFAELREKTTNPTLCLLLVFRWGLAPDGQKRRDSLNRLKPYLVTYDQTKSGKKRSVPISKDLYKTVKKHLENHGGFGTSTISAFRRAVDRSGIQLPQGQCAHILRHTFASHFMMNGVNVVIAQWILGH